VFSLFAHFFLEMFLV